MEKKFLVLGSDGRSVIKMSEGREFPVAFRSFVPQRREAVVYALLDCSGSMEGPKIDQVKQGVMDFALTAFRKGYLLGLIKFDDGARLICEPVAELSLISKQIKGLFTEGQTNLTRALKIASQRLIGKRGQSRVVLVATDGHPNDPLSALKIAEIMKQDRIEILAISTEDADHDFLSKLVSRKDLNLKVGDTELKTGFKRMADKLPCRAIGYKGA